MAFLKRELYRQVKGPEITHEDRCSLVFDTDTKSLYVEREVAHLETGIGGTVEYQTATMDIADYLTQGGQTAGHRELWHLLRALFNEDSAGAEPLVRYSFAAPLNSHHLRPRIRKAHWRVQSAASRWFTLPTCEPLPLISNVLKPPLSW